MSDHSGSGVLHVVSELKVTRTDKFFEKNYFLRVFSKKVFLKACLLREKVFEKEKHNPQ